MSTPINKEGVYIYQCAFHYYCGMFGVIHTGTLSNREEACVVAAVHSKNFIVQEDRLLNHLDRIDTNNTNK